MKISGKRPPKRTSKEEEELISLLKKGIIRCYFCNKNIPEDCDYSTEYGLFYGCGDCYPKWGNPDQDILDEPLKR